MVPVRLVVYAAGDDSRARAQREIYIHRLKWMD
jgi:hypothetical protein